MLARDGVMHWVIGAGLAVWLAAAETAAAQIPRDPLAESSPLPPSASSATQRQSPAAFVTKQSEVEIPFSVRPGSTAETQPTRVRIFVSWDHGRTWHFYDERKPEDARFRFRAKQDGEFWFATQTIDRSGRPDSPEPRSPQLRLVIDTQRPQLLVQANVDSSGNVNLAWSAVDMNLAPTSLKIEYQDASGSGGPWQPVDFQAPAATSTQISSQTTFRAAVTGRTINLRAEIADAVGNTAFFSQRLSLSPPKPPKAAGTTAYAPTADPSATRWPTENPHAEGTPSSQLAGAGEPASRTGEEVRIPNVVSNPFVGTGRLASSRPASESLPPPAAASGPTADAWRPSRMASAADAASERLPMPRESRAGSASGEVGPSLVPSFEPLPPRSIDGGRGAATSPAEDLAPHSPSPMETLPTPQPVESIESPTAQRPRLTNSRRFSLDYDVQSVGPEGLSAVELWGTTDGGRSWAKWGADPDKASPFDVEVNHEAVYGFRIVIVGKNGLATATPQPGDAADIWVGVDLRRPTAKLTGAAYGQAEAAGKLDIRWQAEDVNLGSRPITLSIADRPDGPFKPIAAGLPNTGQYFWEYDPRSPRQIFLRLEARDDAGNIAIDQLTEPIKVEGLEPKGQIRGFSPRPESERGAFRSPLFR
jgi:hypothetical protein